MITVEERLKAQKMYENINNFKTSGKKNTTGAS